MARAGGGCGCLPVWPDSTTLVRGRSVATWRMISCYPAVLHASIVSTPATLFISIRVLYACPLSTTRTHRYGTYPPTHAISIHSNPTNTKHLLTRFLPVVLFLIRCSLCLRLEAGVGRFLARPCGAVHEPYPLELVLLRAVTIIGCGVLLGLIVALLILGLS